MMAHVQLQLLGLLSFLALSQAANGSFTPAHYAPLNTSNVVLSQVINGTGAPGIYNSSVTPAGSYGEYNWCNMPHVRKSEYKVPSSNYTLQYVEVIQRHHKRTPYASNTFPVEAFTWNCTGEGKFAGIHAQDFNTTQVYWQSEHSSRNPFAAMAQIGFPGSTCAFPMITSSGAEDARQHGIDIRGVYGDLLGFLPQSSERSKYQWRVTNNVITTQTASGLVKGIFPDRDLDYALIDSSDFSNFDTLEPNFACAAASAISSAQQASGTEWATHLADSSDLRARLNNVSGISLNYGGGWNTSWDHYYDNLSAKQCHGYPLPVNVNDSSLAVSQTDANEVYRLGNWEYAYSWRTAVNSTLRSALTMGPWVHQLRGHMADNIAGNSTVKYFHNFAHDGSMAPLLGIFQLAQPVWPGMGSELVFELWKGGSTNYVRVLWGGQPMQTSTPLGTLDMVTLEDFDSYLATVLPADPVAACNAA